MRVLAPATMSRQPRGSDVNGDEAIYSYSVDRILETVVNNLLVTPGPIEKQIILHVKFAELNRNEADQLGFNLISTGAANTKPPACFTGATGTCTADTLSATRTPSVTSTA